MPPLAITPSYRRRLRRTSRSPARGDVCTPMGVCEGGTYKSTPIERCSRSGHARSVGVAIRSTRHMGDPRGAPGFIASESAPTLIRSNRVSMAGTPLFSDHRPRVSNTWHLTSRENHSRFARPAVELLGESMHLLAASLEHS